MKIISNATKAEWIRKGSVMNIISMLLMVSLSSCKIWSQEQPDNELRETAYAICEKNIILDSHIDWPYKYFKFPEDISNSITKGDFDLVRAKKGGLDAVLSVAYIPSEFDVDEARILVDSVISLVNHYTMLYPDKFARAGNPGDIEKNFSNNLFSLPLCLENGTPVGNDIDYLRYLSDQGFVYITLNHDKTNQISDSNFDENRPWHGLSPFGLEVIREMNRLGIMIDISHSTDSTVFQSLRVSEAPVIASHSSCRYYTPGLERNLSDTLIKLIADKNGVVMVNFCSMFLDSVCMKNCAYLLHWVESNKLNMESEEAIQYVREYAATHPINSNVVRVVDHIERIIKIAGIDYVGLGSDYDGMGPAQPIGLSDVSCYPAIVVELLKRGYTENDIKKILSGNFLRVWNEVIRVADSLNKNI